VARPQRLATLRIYCQNNPFLVMFQLKFCLKIFETCSLLYVSVLKCSILAIILFEYLLLDPSVKKRPKLSRGLKILEVHEPSAPYFRTYGPPSGVTLIQQCFKCH